MQKELAGLMQEQSGQRGYPLFMSENVKVS